MRGKEAVQKRDRGTPRPRHSQPPAALQSHSNDRKLTRHLRGGLGGTAQPTKPPIRLEVLVQFYFLTSLCITLSAAPTGPTSNFPGCGPAISVANLAHPPGELGRHPTLGWPGVQRGVGTSPKLRAPVWFDQPPRHPAPPRGSRAGTGRGRSESGTARDPAPQAGPGGRGERAAPPWPLPPGYLLYALSSSGISRAALGTRGMTRDPGSCSRDPASTPRSRAESNSGSNSEAAPPARLPGPRCPPAEAAGYSHQLLLLLLQ